MAQDTSNSNAPLPLPTPSYPAIEAFIEVATHDEVGALFASVTEAVAHLKGPRAEQGKRVLMAVEHTQALLSHLLQVRENIEASRAAAR